MATPDTSSAQAGAVTRMALPCEIRVVDEEKREIEVCATSEAVDMHGTVFDYAASKDAFERWAGNVREMHERKAVGRRVAVRCDDAAHRIYVRLRISAGAQDTWEKVLDGTLAGASIGAANVEWRNQRRNGGADVPVATRYDLIELSLVDLPSNPDAQGVTFVRDAVPDADLLDTMDSDFNSYDHFAAGAQDSDNGGNGGGGNDDPSPTPVAPQSPVTIREGAGSLSAEDPALAIAEAALKRGQQSVQNTAAQARNVQGGDVAAGQNHSGPVEISDQGGSMPKNDPSQQSPRARKLAALGAPRYAQTRAASSSDTAPGAMFDGDGDHDGNVDDAMPHADELHAHEAHSHAHDGSYDNVHRHDGESTAHMHLDGTSHIHEHIHDHGHHDHDGLSAETHSHGHIHNHDHGHYYRVADGAALDERLVSGEQLRTREYVSQAAFDAARGVPGYGLTAAQYRVAAGVEARMELMAAEQSVRAQGAFSRNPYGAADIGTPAEAQAAPTDDEMAVKGGVRELDRDGQPTDCDDEASTGTLDVSDAPDGFVQITDQRAMAAAVSAAVEAQIARALAPALAPLSTLTTIEQRLARIEAQPQSGGPIFRTAEKSTPLTPSSGNGSSSRAEQLRALEGLAGRIADPQAQVAVAAEMIRLQQEQAGMSPAQQVMPRAGRGWREESRG